MQLDLTNYRLCKTASLFSLLRIGTAPPIIGTATLHQYIQGSLRLNFFWLLSINCKYYPMSIKMHFNKIMKISNWSQN